MILNDIVIDMHQGINTVADKVVYQSSGIPIIQSKNFTKGYLDLEDVRYLGENDKRKYKDKYNPKKGDILLANIGTIGKSILINEDLEFLIAWNAFLIRINHNVFNANLLNFYFNYLADTRYFDRLLTGGTVKFVNKKKIGEIFIPDISLEKQSELCNVLTIITRIIQTQRKKIALLDELVKARFVEMFGKEKNTQKLGDLVLICRGASPRPISSYTTKNENGENWIKIGDVEENDIYINHAAEKVTKAGADKSRRVKVGDFILSNSMSFGRPYILNIDGCVHDGWLIISEYEKSFEQLFLYYLLRSDDVQAQFNGTVSGAVVKNLNSDKVRETKVFVPSKDKQKEFVEFSKQIDKSKFICQKKIDHYQELFDKKMNEYFG